MPSDTGMALDDFAYDELWQAIADATRIDGGIIAISVVKFREAIRRLTPTDTDTAIPAGEDNQVFLERWRAFIADATNEDAMCANIGTMRRMLALVNSALKQGHRA